MTLIHGFIKPLRENKLLKDTEIQGIFANVEIIFDFQKELLKQFRTRVESWESQPLLGDVFTTLSPFLKVYTTYVENFEKGSVTLKNAKKQNSQFNAFLRKCHEKKEMYGNLDLEDYLLMPVQRIPRYQLLLQELLKCTEESHPDFIPLQSALSKIKEVAVHINTWVKTSDNKQKIVEIQNELSMELVAPHRVWLESGVVSESTVPSAVNPPKVLYRYTFHLLNDMLILYCKAKRRVIQLTTAWVTDYYKVPNAFQMLSPGEGILLVTDSSSERDHMISQISMAIQDIVSHSTVYSKERAKYCLVAEGSGELFQVKEVEEVSSARPSPPEPTPQQTPQPTGQPAPAARRRHTVVRGSLADTTYVESEESFELVYSDELGWHLAAKAAVETEQTTPPVDNAVPKDPIPTQHESSEASTSSESSSGHSVDQTVSKTPSVDYSSSPGGLSLEENLSRVVLTSSAEYSSSPGGEYYITESEPNSRGQLTSSSDSVGASEGTDDGVPITKIPFRSTKPRAVVRSSHVRIGSGSGWQFCGPSLELKKEFEEYDKFVSLWGTSTVGSGPSRESLRSSKLIVIGNQKKSE